MGKRFTDPDKWKDDWYLSLSNDYRIVWQYVLDNCDNAGVLKKNLRLLNFCCNTNISDSDIKTVFNGRLIDHCDSYFIPKFLLFQYPSGLNSDKPAIVSVRSLIEKHGLSSIVRESFGNHYLMIKDKDKDKDKDNTSSFHKEEVKYKVNFKKYKDNIESKYINGEIDLDEKQRLIGEWK